jgi:hypothetical protein
MDAMVVMVFLVLLALRGPKDLQGLPVRMVWTVAMDCQVLPVYRAPRASLAPWALPVLKAIKALLVSRGCKVRLALRVLRAPQALLALLGPPLLWQSLVCPLLLIFPCKNRNGTISWR